MAVVHIYYHGIKNCDYGPGPTRAEFLRNAVPQVYNSDTRPTFYDWWNGQGNRIDALIEYNTLYYNWYSGCGQTLYTT